MFYKQKKQKIRTKPRYKQLKYKDIPEPMCRCYDCREARRPIIKGYMFKYDKRRPTKWDNFRVAIRKNRHKNIYQIVNELKRGVLFVQFNNGGFSKDCPIKKDIFKIINQENIPYSLATINYGTVWCIDLPYDFDGNNSPSLELLDKEIEVINKEDRYSKYRIAWAIASLSPEGIDELTEDSINIANNVVNLYYRPYIEEGV